MSTASNSILDLGPLRASFIRYLVAFATLGVGIIGLTAAPSIEYEGWGTVLVVAVSITTVPVAVWWAVRKIVLQRHLVTFVLYADGCVATCLLFKQDYLAAISGTVLFAVVGTLAVIGASVKLGVAHLLVSLAVLAVVAWKTYTTEAASGWVVASHSLTMILMFASPSILFLYVGELRQRANAALVDPLTGVANRRGLLKAVDDIAAEMDGSPVTLAVIVMDVDGLKEINDCMGHGEGDAVLVRVAGALRTMAPDCRAAARLGGDEFVCLFAGDPSVVRRATEVAQDLNSAPHTGWSVSAGLAGITVWHADHVQDAFEEMSRRADVELYRAKSLRS